MCGVPPAAALRGVTRYFGTLHALGPIDLEFRPGEFFSVVGPSGCGKSTLLEVLAGLSAPTSGSVAVAGDPVAGFVPSDVGIVFQDDASFPWLSVWNNIAFGLRRHGVRGDELRQRVDHAVAFMGLAQFARTRPAELSGGMRQRVC
ncbi:MAG: ABC transporter ATP-binding protein, partial [Casimicrobiaceae bacterium]